MRFSRAALIVLTLAAIACSDTAGVSTVPGRLETSGPQTTGSGLLIVGENTLSKLSLPGFAVQKTLPGVTDAILLPDGRIAASTWNQPDNSANGGWSVVLLEPETLNEIGRVHVGELVEVIGPNPAPALAISTDGTWLVGIRWPEEDIAGYDVELWAVRDPLRLMPEGISLPGCGVGWPASGTKPKQFTVLCTNSGDARLVTLNPDGGGGQVTVLPLPPARTGGADSNGNPLSLDRMLGMSAASDGTVYVTRGGGEIQRLDPEGQDITNVGAVAVTRYLPGINVLSSGGDILYVGSGPLSDREGATGRRQADQLHAIDLTNGTQLWKIDMQQPFTHLAVGPDGSLYAAMFPHGDPPSPDPALMRIDPNARTAEIVIDDLSITPGPITVLP